MSAQRLPTPGGDDGNWGDILNAYLNVSLAVDGSLNSNVVGTNQIQSGAVTNFQLDSTTQSSLLKADSALQSAPVSSVNSMTGAVSLVKADIGLGNVDDTSDISKPISTATQAALNAKAASSSLAAVATSGSYTDLLNQPAAVGIPDATTSSKGALQLAGDLNGTAAAPTLANTSNVSTIVGSIISSNSAVNGAVQKSNNLSDLASAATARTNLGLGTAATQTISAFDAAGAAANAQAAAEA
jgi:hypothetical protein